MSCVTGFSSIVSGVGVGSALGSSFDAVGERPPESGGLVSHAAYVDDLLHTERYSIIREFTKDGSSADVPRPAREVYERLVRVLHLTKHSWKRSLATMVKHHTDASGLVSPAVFGSSRGARKPHAGEDNEDIKRYCSGVLTKAQAQALQTSRSEVGLGMPRPRNILGDAHTLPPFAVLGDSERMRALGSHMLNQREQNIRNTFEPLSTDGNMIHMSVFVKKLPECLAGMGMRLTMPQKQATELAYALDPDQAGFISISRFIRMYSMELMKRPSMRSTLLLKETMSWGGAPRERDAASLQGACARIPPAPPPKGFHKRKLVDKRNTVGFPTPPISVQRSSNSSFRRRSSRG